MSGHIPGELLPGAADAEEPEHADVIEVVVRNTGDRPVQVASHYHLFEVNPALQLDRRAVFGRRLAIAAGTAMRFEPGEQRTVAAVAYGGARIVRGFLGAVDGPLDAPGAVERAVAVLRRLSAALP